MQATYYPCSNLVAINLVEIGAGGIKSSLNCNTFRKPWYCWLVLMFDQFCRMIAIDVVMEANRLLPLDIEQPDSNHEMEPILLPDLVTLFYDEKIDAAYLWFWGKDSALLKASKYHCPKKKSKTDIFIHFDAANHLLGLEIHRASKFLPPEVLEIAQKGHGG